MLVSAVIVAAGKGRRMGSSVPKQFMELCGRPVLAHSLAAFEKSRTDSVVIVTSKEDIPAVQKIVAEYGFTKVTAVTAGGEERCDSCFAGVRYLFENGEKPDIILVHDAARALVTPELIDRVTDDAARFGAACPAVRVVDTMRTVGPDGFATGTVDRESLRSIQTPQGFDAELLYRSYLAYYDSRERSGRSRADGSEGTVAPGLTDDAMAVELYGGQRSYLCEGSASNIKITTPDDITAAERIIASRGV